MNKVVELSNARRRRGISLIGALATVVVIGAGIGVGTHYAVQSGVAGAVIDRMTTAAVSLADGPTIVADDSAPAFRSANRVLPPALKGKRFALCQGGHRVTCVVDGDTLWIDGTKIRVADIDAPEIFSPKCRSEKALGDRATQRLIQLVNGGPFELRAWEGRDHDQYGRALRVLVRGGRSLGDILVQEGLARTWSGRREPWC